MRSARANARWTDSALIWWTVPHNCITGSSGRCRLELWKGSTSVDILGRGLWLQWFKFVTFLWLAFNDLILAQWQWELFSSCVRRSSCRSFTCSRRLEQTNQRRLWINLNQLNGTSSGPEQWPMSVQQVTPNHNLLGSSISFLIDCILILPFIFSDPCRPDPCTNNGACFQDPLNEEFGYICVCPPGFLGQNCEAGS